MTAVSYAEFRTSLRETHQLITNPGGTRMTVQREPIHLALESAPTDRFDDDAARVFRVVAFVGTGATRRHKVSLTRDHDCEQDAMSVFADKVLRAAPVDTLTGLVVQGHVDRLTARIDQLPIRRGRR